jgi:DNA-binding MarR family transcriptional regulator
MPIRAEGNSRSETMVAEPTSLARQDPAVETARDEFDQLPGAAPGPGEQFGDDVLVGVARAVIEARHTRTHALPPAIFGEPAWDMLLALYTCPRSEEGERVSNLSLSSGTPATTTLRWIDYLEREGFVTRRSCPTDKRVVFIQLTDKASDAIGTYLGSLLEKRIIVPPQS